MTLVAKKVYARVQCRCSGEKLYSVGRHTIFRGNNVLSHSLVHVSLCSRVYICAHAGSERAERTGGRDDFVP